MIKTLSTVLKSKRMKLKKKDKKTKSSDAIVKNDFDLEEIHLDNIYDHSSKLIEYKSDNKITALEFIQERKKKNLTSYCCFCFHLNRT